MGVGGIYRFLHSGEIFLGLLKSAEDAGLNVHDQEGGVFQVFLDLSGQNLAKVNISSNTVENAQQKPATACCSIPDLSHFIV